MGNILNDLNEIPQDWFDEIYEKDAPKETELSSIDFDMYQAECELLGNMILELYICTDGYYYMKMNVLQPIGDYGSHWAVYWYKCEEQYIEEIKKILDKAEMEE